MLQNEPGNVSEYFKNGIRKINEVHPNDDYTLDVLFDNGEWRVYDLSSSLYGVFDVLKDTEKFKEVFIDEAGNISWDIDKNLDSRVAWNNRIDICKDAAYIDSTPK